MKVLFAQKEHPIEPLGIGYISSSIARGKHKSFLELTPKDTDKAASIISDRIKEYGSEIFAQSIIFGSHLYAAELNRKIKERHPNLVTVLGGPAATFTPELIEKGFDAICRYEGENPFWKFCDSLERGEDVGNIPNMWVKKNPKLYRTDIRRTKKISDINNPEYKEESGYDPERKRFVNATGNLLEKGPLDDIPFPDRELLYNHKIFADGPIKHFMHTRGCAFKCSYCFNVIQNEENKGKGKSVRARLHESVIEEIKEVKKKWPMELVYFQDDVFGPSYRLSDAIEFAEIYSREINLPFHAHVRFDLFAKYPEMAKVLADAGMTGVHVAIEAGNDFIRNKVHVREMSTQQVLDGAKYLNDAGIKMMTQNILGAPGETLKNMLETVELNIAVKPTYASASIFQPYPGTTTLEKARDSGAIPAKELNDLALSDSFELESFYDKSIIVRDPKKRRSLEVLQKFFAVAVESPHIYTSGTLERIISNYPEGAKVDEELNKMYRKHRAVADEKLYGVKLRDVVIGD